MRSNSGKPLGIYVHIPFCKSKCEYCDFYSLGGSRDRRTTDQYLQALADHIRETGRLAPDYTVDTVYFGGGTPSFFGAENLEKILDELQKRFHFGADPEITLEANPDSVTPQGSSGWSARASTASPSACSPIRTTCSSASAVRIPTSRRAWPSSARARRALPISRST